jgi:hypothetical protein
MSFLKRIGKKVPKGIYKYKNFKDAQEDTLQWILMD